MWFYKVVLLPGHLLPVAFFLHTLLPILNICTIFALLLYYSKIARSLKWLDRGHDESFPIGAALCIQCRSGRYYTGACAVCIQVEAGEGSGVRFLSLGPYLARVYGATATYGYIMLHNAMLGSATPLQYQVAIAPELFSQDFPSEIQSACLIALSSSGAHKKLATRLSR
jgi:hypothetical protein